jgi:two-component system sensor histidine kinase BaeS
MLSLSDMGALTYQKEPLDLAELIDDALAAQHGALQAKGMAVRTTLARGLHIDGDAARLAQVFANLLQNTLRYTDAPGALQVTLTREAQQAVLQWQDSHPAVPEADLPRLTERLYRVDSSRSRAGGGSGLGLAIVQAIVEAHGGTLVAQPSALGGLAWRIAFPLLDSSARHA